ncbi:MAG: hypothetical protein R6U32_04305 [Candidatus Woesearchaeota archaeon]
MELKREVEALQKNDKFREWKGKSENKDNFLSYILFMTGDEEDKLQVGYYNKENEKATTFDISGKDERKVDIRSEEEVFKRPDMEVNRLDLESVDIEVGDALSTADKLQKEKYPAEIPIKVIVILQKLSPYGQIYNITYVTKTFKTLNIKVDAGTGDIVEDHLVSLIQFPSSQQKE